MYANCINRRYFFSSRTVMGDFQRTPISSCSSFFGGMGGGDIKLMAAAGLVPGLPAGIFATILGLLLVLAYSVFLKICKKTQVIAVPLVPFLSAGCAAGYLIG